MSCFEQSLPVFINLLFIVLLVLLIILVINLLKTLKKANKTIDDVNQKLNSLDGMFSMIDQSTDFIVKVNDKILSFIMDKVNKLFRKKEEKEDE